MNGRLIIIGAGGHGRVVRDIAENCAHYSEIYFLDDDFQKDSDVIGCVNDFEKFLENSDFAVAIGNNYTREKILNKLLTREACLPSLVHPKAVVAKGVQIKDGTVVMAGAVINTGASIGKGVIINTCSSVDHDCTIGDFCHISVGAHLAGTVTLGERTFLAIGSSVINNIKIAPDCILAAGAVAVNDLTEKGVYKGIPAKK